MHKRNLYLSLYCKKKKKKRSLKYPKKIKFFFSIKFLFFHKQNYFFTNKIILL